MAKSNAKPSEIMRALIRNEIVTMVSSLIQNQIRWFHRDAKIFSDYGFEVVGIDFSSKMVEAAKQNSPKSAFYIMDIEKLAFAFDSFDGVWANCALVHVHKKSIPAVLDKIHTILKPKGSLYLSVKQSDICESFEEDSRYGRLEKYWSFFERNELINLLTCSRFEISDVVITSKNTDYHTHPIIKIFARKQ